MCLPAHLPGARDPQAWPGPIQTYSGGILQKLSNGSMPCDAAWPQERVDLFRR